MRVCDSFSSTLRVALKLQISSEETEIAASLLQIVVFSNEHNAKEVAS